MLLEFFIFFFATRIAFSFDPLGNLECIALSDIIKYFPLVSRWKNIFEQMEKKMLWICKIYDIKF